MKILVGQTRAQCANEVRKRERTIEGMKKHVGEGGRARGGGKPVGVVTVNVIPGVGGDGGGATGVALEDSIYDLRSETNEFLTELARGLSEENENVAALLRRTVDTLKVLSGCEKEGIQQEGGMVVQLDGGYENLASEMDVIIEHLRTLLTNPSFVPLEEVEIREEEIIRLREGWERMESRWREAVQMMDGWRKRMARSGQTVNLEELKMGLMLSPLKSKDEEGDNGNGHGGFQLSTLMEEGEGDTQADIDAMDDSGFPQAEPQFDEDSEDSESSLFEEEPMDEHMEDPAEEQQQQEYSLNTESSASPGPAPQLSPLRETAGNRLLHPNGPQKYNFTTIIEENTYDLLQLDDASTPQKVSRSTKSTPNAQSRKPLNLERSIATDDEISLLKTSAASQQSQQQLSPPRQRRRESPPKPSRAAPTPKQTPRLRTDASSRLPRPRDNAMPQQSPLTMATIAAKLAATEREADAARVRAKIKAAKLNRVSGEKSSLEASKLMPPPPAPRTEGQEAQPVKIPLRDDEDANGEARGKKRKVTGGRQGGRASRRRSTLSPWEMESLILGGVGAVASPEK